MVGTARSSDGVELSGKLARKQNWNNDKSMTKLLTDQVASKPRTFRHL